MSEGTSPAPRRGNTRGPQLNALVRRQYVFSLRCTGASYEAIYQAAQRRFGTELPHSYNRRSVHRDVMEEMQVRRDGLQETVELVRVLELQRLDQLQLAIWPRAIGTPADFANGIPAVPAELEAQQQILRLMQQRMRLLPGLAAPVKVAPTTPDGEAAYSSSMHVDEAFCVEVAQLLAAHGLMYANGNGADPGPYGDPDANGAAEGSPTE